MINLEKCELFSSMSSHYINELIKQIPYTIKKYKKNELIYTQFNCYSKEIGIILKGNVIVYKFLYNGDRFLLSKLSKNSLLGVAYLYSDSKTFPGEVQTSMATEILFLSQESLNKLFVLEPKIMMNFLNVVSNKLVLFTNKIEMMALPSIRDRLEWLIYNKIYSKDSLNKVNKTQLSHELGTSRSTLYRALNDVLINESI